MTIHETTSSETLRPGGLRGVAKLNNSECDPIEGAGFFTFVSEGSNAGLHSPRSKHGRRSTSAGFGYACFQPRGMPGRSAPSTSTFTSGRGFLRRLNHEVKETRKSVRASTGKVGRRETTVRVLTKHGIPPTSEFVVESFCQALSTAGPRLVTTRVETACDCRAFIPPCCSCQVMSAAGWQCHRHWRLRRWVRKFCVLGSSSRIHESEAS